MQIQADRHARLGARNRERNLGAHNGQMHSGAYKKDRGYMYRRATYRCAKENAIGRGAQEDTNRKGHSGAQKIEGGDCRAGNK
jgi:hypothetical protein